jgi:hypothetical protein
LTFPSGRWSIRAVLRRAGSMLALAAVDER